MRRTAPFLLAILLLAGCQQPSRLYQISTLQALMEGAYDGQVTVRDLARNGQIGIGTFDGLDGEMIVLDGRVYQAKSDGTVCVADANMTTPFANVASFAANRQVNFNRLTTMPDMQAQLDKVLPSPNLFYAVRLDGQFASVRVRSIPRQTRPYPRLADAAKQQKVYELKNVRGTLVGFRFPQYAAGINMPGWHLHFISDDRKHGGHVLDGQLSTGWADIGELRRFEMVLPAGGKFFEADLGRQTADELRRIEH